MLSVLDLAREDNVHLHKESVNSKCGPCPNYTRGICRCGTDGFVVKWDNGEWRFSCRGCWPADEWLPEKDRKRGFGDAIDYLWHFRGVKYREAKALVNDGETSQKKAAPPVRNAGYTTAFWQERTASAVTAAVDRLQSDDGAQALEYARSRGLDADTIRAAHMGYSLHEGIPRLIIPSFNDGRYVAIYRRDLRPDAPKGKRWKDAPGGTKNELYLADGLKRKQVTVLVEAPICALTILQVYRGDGNINAVATGGSKNARSAKSLRQLARMPLVLVAFDADAAGDKDAEYWLKLLPNARRLRPLLIDVNAMFVDGWDIKEWIDQAVAQALQVNEPLEESILAVGPSLCGVCLDTAGIEREALPDDVDGNMYCVEHHPARRRPQHPMTEAQFMAIIRDLAAVFPGGCTIHRDPPGYTIKDRARELAATLPNESRGDYWADTQAKMLRSPENSYGKPFYTPAAWDKKYHELKNWRPDDSAYAHLPGGYAGYCQMYQPGQEAPASQKYQFDTFAPSTESTPQPTIAKRRKGRTVPSHTTKPTIQAGPEDIEALCQKHHFKVGEPCQRCGCPVQYERPDYTCCVRCYPYPLRGDDDYSSIIDAVYPRLPEREQATRKA